jgi:predicted transcriptional regulator
MSSHSNLGTLGTVSRPDEKIVKTKPHYQRRSRTDIVYEICQVVSEKGETKCKLQYKVGLSWKQINQYIDVLIENELLEFKDGKYYATQKGRNFIVMIKEIETMCKPFVEEIKSLYERKKQLKELRRQ